MVLAEEQAKDLIQQASIEALEQSLEKYGLKVAVKRIPKRFLSKETNLVLEQDSESGLALGHDGRNLWVALHVFVGTHYWNTNTELTTRTKYRGTEINSSGKGTLGVEIARDHPVSRLVALLKARGWQGNVRLANKKTNFAVDQAAEVIIEDDGRLTMRSPTGDAKLVLTDLKADWQDGKWKPGAKQRLTIG